MPTLPSVPVIAHGMRGLTHNGACASVTGLCSQRDVRGGRLGGGPRLENTSHTLPSLLTPLPPPCSATSSAGSSLGPALFGALLAPFPRWARFPLLKPPMRFGRVLKCCSQGQAVGKDVR